MIRRMKRSVCWDLYFFPFFGGGGGFLCVQQGYIVQPDDRVILVAHSKVHHRLIALDVQKQSFLRF